jgi:SAM-dependent methyltransferase
MEDAEYYKMFEFEDNYWWYRGLHELVEHFVNTFHSDQPLRILDAGCGTGRMLELLKNYGIIEGIDFSPLAVTLCEHRQLKNIEIANLNHWDSREKTYDVLISNDVICTSNVDDDLAVVKKFHRALKPGGALILNLPAFDCLRRPHDTAVFGKRRYRKKKLVNDLERIGFRIVMANYRLPFLFLFILIQKNINKLFASDKKITSDLNPLPSILNRSLLFLNRIENKMIISGLPFPFGSSLFVVCKKK